MSEERTIYKEEFPGLLGEITDPPAKLFLKGELPSNEHKFLCVVGSRKYSQYGQDAIEKLLSGLAGYPIVIVSGLALGVDGLAHKTALKYGLKTIAVPGSGIDESVLYPRVHVGLSREILQKGGALLSESAPQEKATVWSFPKRNRIMAGMCHATLIVEAFEKSGTLITARLAMEYNRDVLVVPGSINSPHSRGSNSLLREGAQAVTKSEDIIEALGLKVEEKKENTFEELSENEKNIMQFIEEPKTIDEISEQIGVEVSKLNIILSTLEIKGFVTKRLGKITRLV